MKTGKYRWAATIFGLFLLLLGVELFIIFGLWWRDTHQPFTIEMNKEEVGEERSVIKEHTIMGGKVLENFTEIEGLKDGALYHHERFDGTGYPFGLKGKEIPFYARIIGVADSFDTMNSDRVYRERLPKEKILEELKKNAGTQFDPEIVKYMIEIIQEGFIDQEISSMM